MLGGKLDNMVEIQRRTVTQSPSGELVESWATLSRRWASFTTLNGVERYAAQQLVAKAQFAFTVRWSQEVADVSPNDRLVWPAPNSQAPPRKNSLYDIFAVEPIGRNEALKLLATVRQDQDN